MFNYAGGQFCKRGESFLRAPGVVCNQILSPSRLVKVHHLGRQDGLSRWPCNMTRLSWLLIVDVSFEIPLRVQAIAACCPSRYCTKDCPTQTRNNLHWEVSFTNKSA